MFLHVDNWTMTESTWLRCPQNKGMLTPQIARKMLTSNSEEIVEFAGSCLENHLNAQITAVCICMYYVCAISVCLYCMYGCM